MTIQAGTRLGPYEIVAPIGAGGMGEVYRARDTRLGRDVAIKVLPSDFSADAGRRERFEREARAISRLSHPNVCTLHDIGQHDGLEFLVMELLEGESLADRLARGPLPLSQLIRYGADMAHALAQAHRQGIIHRDLKPGNVMLTKSGAKVLDFGLARYSGAAEGDQTDLRPITAEGSILGTIQYMSPEQLEGKEADARSDIFALGAILYEMATGKRAFTGKSKASLIASILEHEPEPVSRVQPASPAALDRIIQICLNKDPDQRWQSAQDVALELESLTEVSEAHPPSRAKWIVIAVAAAVLGIVVGLMAARSLWRDRASRARSVHFSFFPPENGFVPLHRQNVMLTVSLDGRRVALVAGTSGQSQLWIHSLDSNETKPLAGTEGAVSPFWSPDGNFLGFYAAGKLRKIDLRSGDIQSICAVSKTGAVADWGPGGTILFVENAGASSVVKRVAAAGGSPSPVGGPPPLPEGQRFRWRSPQLLPDGDHFLVGLRSNIGRALYVRSLDGKTKLKHILDTDSKARFVPPDWVAYVRDGVLVAQKFDLSRLEPVGEPITLASAVHYFRPTGAAMFDLSESTLVYQPTASVNQLVWMDRTGAFTGVVGGLGNLQAPSISPDGKSIAISVPDSKSGLVDIWVYDIARGFRNRLTPKDNFEGFPVWSPDGRQIVFSMDQRGPPHLHMLSLTEPGRIMELTGPDVIQVPTDWSRDGKLILVTKLSVEGGSDVWVLPMTGERRARLLLGGDADEHDGRFSPDGRWVSFTSDDTGTAEIYVIAVDHPETRIRVSTDGGRGARWNSDGSELFYINNKGELMSVPVKRGATVDFGTPRVITRLEGTRSSSSEIDEDYTYDPVSRRFLINRANTGRLSVPIQVVVNWQSR